MSSSILGLPPIPVELKPMTPYLQRAEELKKQDPIIAYWCAYYAAQVGISLKARDAQSRDVLFALLGVLEHMKSDIGTNDAIDIEAVSSAYVENFALKVFANADNEDRSARATRSTAKKFLAAANFLEVLKTFTKTEPSESNEEKIRYAKWKAADIAKAFREGRKPTSGPPGWAEEQEELKRLQQEKDQFELPPPPTLPPTTSSESTHIASSPPRSSHVPSSSPGKPSLTSSSPPKPDHYLKIDRPHTGWSERGDHPSAAWSTAATPGTEAPDVYTLGTPSPKSAGFGWNADSPTRSGHTNDKRKWDGNEEGRTKPRSGSISSSNTAGSNSGSGRTMLKKDPWTNEELESKYSPSSSPPKTSFKSGSPDSDKKVHFSSSTLGSPSSAPPPQVKSGSPKEYLGPSSIYAPPQLPPTIASPTYSIPSYPSSGSPPSLPPSSSSPPRSYVYAPSVPTYSSPTRSGYGYPNAPPPPPLAMPIQDAFELTPSIIAKAQRHCRFAISSLDYEDPEQARKELRAALALLGD